MLVATVNYLANSEVHLQLFPFHNRISSSSSAARLRNAYGCQQPSGFAEVVLAFEQTKE